MNNLLVITNFRRLFHRVEADKITSIPMCRFIFTLFICLVLSVNSLFTQPRVVVSSDFPPVDVIPGGAGFGPDHLRSDADNVQSMIRKIRDCF